MSEKSTTSTDPDSPPRFTREMAERGRHMVGNTVIREARPRGRPRMAESEKKEQVSLRLSPNVLAFFREGGEGWQTRIDEALREHVRIATAAAPGNLHLADSEPSLAEWWRCGLFFHLHHADQEAYVNQVGGMSGSCLPRNEGGAGVWALRKVQGPIVGAAFATAAAAAKAAATGRGRAIERDPRTGESVPRGKRRIKAEDAATKE